MFRLAGSSRASGIAATIAAAVRAAPSRARSARQDGPSTIPTFTGCLVEARPVGLFHLVDRGKADEKVLAVPLGDPYASEMHDLDDVPPHYLKEIEHFFRVYKDLEGTTTETRGFENAAAARAAIVRAQQLYSEKFAG
jgi:inorganic pyrophosphatase